MGEAEKYASQLRLVGKKVFQLREAVAGNFFDPNDPNSWPMFLKSALYVTTGLRQIQAGVPAEASVLSIIPSDKIWQNPTAVPELLKFPAFPQTNEKYAQKRDPDFFAEMETYCQEAVMNLDASVSEPKKEEISRSDLPSCSAALATIFKRTSAQRLKS
jgi:hypothetical protein